MTAFLAIDWGTTNLRGWRIGSGGEIETETDLPLGVARLPPGGARECFETQVRPQLDPERRLPALMCGMAGSNIGWRAAPYAACPADLKALLARLISIEGETPLVRIVPGLRTDGIARAPDVMRGEETQVFGWAALNPARSRGTHIICHPGTHSKWVTVEDGVITAFVTAMTGELFDVLSRHSILAGGYVSDDEAAFAAGLAAAGDGDALAARLFSARARIVAGGADPETAPSYLSGLLIGAEIAAAPQLVGAVRDADIHVVGSPTLRDAYVRALQASGWTCTQCDGEAASVAGLKALVAGGALE